MNIIDRFIGHLCTINKHRMIVRKLCFKYGLYWQGLTHDLSKYSPVEFWNGVRFYTGTCSPHVGERKKYGFSRAWIHHKICNKHHVEYWRDIKQHSKDHPIEIPNRYFVEMICDRVAASMIYKGTDCSEFTKILLRLSHKDETYFHQNTKVMLSYWLATIENYGLDGSFEQIKYFLKNENSLK